MRRVLTRRAWLGGAIAATASLVAGGRAAAQQMQTHMPPGTVRKPKGPIVFLDYDQEELDANYDQTPWAPNQAEVLKRNAQKSAAALTRLGAPRRLSYGATEIEKLDLYATSKPDAPLQMWIHGGAWRTGKAADAAFMAEMFVDAGAHFLAVDFNDVIETKGDLTIMAQQVRRAVAWVYKNAASFGGNPERLYLTGHSSGGQLAGVALTTDWAKGFGLPSRTVAGGLLLSGIFDLNPVSLSSRRTYVQFTPQIVDALSPQRHLDALTAPLIVANGTNDAPEFQRQSREFASAVRAAGKTATSIVLDGCNHFEVWESLGNPYGVLGRAVLQQMGLRPAA